MTECPNPIHLAGNKVIPCQMNIIILIEVSGWHPFHSDRFMASASDSLVL
jgi:hypothetical protein